MTLRLPDDALIRTSPELRRRLREARQWTNDTELLAQAVELLSVIASEYQIKKPVDVPRPRSVGERGGGAGRNPYARAIDRMRGSSVPRRRS